MIAEKLFFPFFFFLLGSSSVTVSPCLQCDKQPRPETPRRGSYPRDCLCFAQHSCCEHSAANIPGQLWQPSHHSHDCCSRYVQFCPCNIAWLDGTHVVVSCVIHGMCYDTLDHTYGKTCTLHAACVYMAKHTCMLRVLVAKLELSLCKPVKTSAAGQSITQISTSEMSPAPPPPPPIPSAHKPLHATFTLDWIQLNTYC